MNDDLIALVQRLEHFENRMKEYFDMPKKRVLKGNYDVPRPVEIEQQDKYIDEFFVRRLGPAPAKVQVLRRVGQAEIEYCLCDNWDAAVIIALALNKHFKEEFESGRG